jgi:uncharacterized lipoprotein YmbA
VKPSTVALLCGLFASAGCSVLSPRDDPTRFYVLSPVDAPPGPPTHVVLGVGPVTLPRYLEESSLARRVGSNEVRFSDFDRWAGPLEGQVSTTLAENLHTLLGADRLVVFPWYQDAMVDAAVAVDVFQFEPAEDGQAHLAARWKLTSRDGTLVRTADVDLREPVNGRSTDATVAALSGVLGRLAQDIANAVRASGMGGDGGAHRRRAAE